MLRIHSEFRKEILKISRCCYNLVISGCCFAEDGKEMNQEFQHPCTAIVLLIKLFVWCHSRCHSRRFWVSLTESAGQTRSYYAWGIWGEGFTLKTHQMFFVYTKEKFFICVGGKNRTTRFQKLEMDVSQNWLFSWRSKGKHSLHNQKKWKKNESCLWYK